MISGILMIISAYFQDTEQPGCGYISTGGNGTFISDLVRFLGSAQTLCAKQQAVVTVSFGSLKKVDQEKIHWLTGQLISS